MNNKLNNIIKWGIFMFLLFLPVINVIAYLALLTALISWAIKTKFKNILTSRVIKIPLLSFAFAVLLSVIFSHDKPQSLAGYLLFSFYILTFILMTHQKENRNKILQMLVLSMLIVSIFGIIQYFTKLNFHIKTSWFSFTIHTDEWGIGSTFDNPNRLAEYLIPIILLSFAFLLSKIPIKMKLFIGISTIAGIICLMLSKCLAGIIIIIILIPIILIIKNWKFGLPFLFIAIVFMGFIKKDFSTFANKSFTTPNSLHIRAYTWGKIVPQIMKSYPLTGYGLATSKEITDKYGEGNKTVHPHLHNLYINYLCECGILGIITFLLFIGIFLRITIPLLKINSETFAYTFAVIGMLLHGITETIIHFFPLGLLFWTLIGLALTAYVKTPKIQN
ncbi:MAG: O-antigen ligase family protein [bacterium]|nr:O-antigen ligase family protein [bacterium]